VILSNLPAERGITDMEQVTDFADLHGSVLASEYFSLPSVTRKLMEAYWFDVVSDGVTIRFKIASYRWPEIEAVIYKEEEA